MSPEFKKLFFLLLTLALILALLPAGTTQAKKPAPKLTCTIEYDFVGLDGIVDAEGRLLCWQGPISGDIEGVIQWWMSLSEDDVKDTGQVGHHAGGRFVICDDDGGLLLAGEGAGSTTIRHGKNSIWRSNGTVTGAHVGWEDWIGRRVYQDGHFTWQNIGTPEDPIIIPEHGTGTLRVN